VLSGVGQKQKDHTKMPQTLRQIFKHEWTDAEDIACQIQDLWKAVNGEGEEFYRNINCRPRVLVCDVLKFAVPLAEKILALKTKNEEINNVAQSLLTTAKEPPFKYRADVIRRTGLQLAEMALLSPRAISVVQHDPDMPF
jgi:hypothetical protein